MSDVFVYRTRGIGPDSTFRPECRECGWEGAERTGPDNNTAWSRAHAAGKRHRCPR